MSMQRTFAGALLGAALAIGLSAGCSVPAFAMIPLERYQAVRDAPDILRFGPARNGQQAEQLIDSATGDLKQAALESQLASDQRLLSLLRSAQGKLNRALAPLSGERWRKVDSLLSDIDHAVAREQVQLGRLVSSNGETFIAPAPGRSELAVLAKEGQALEHHASFRPTPDTDDIAWLERSRSTSAGTGALPPAALPRPVMPPDLLGGEAAWPQFFRRL